MPFKFGSLPNWCDDDWLNWGLCLFSFSSHSLRMYIGMPYLYFFIGNTQVLCTSHYVNSPPLAQISLQTLSHRHVKDTGINMRHATRTGKKRTIPRRWRSTHSSSGLSMIIHSSSILSSVLAHTRDLGWGRGHVFYDLNRSNFGAPSTLASPFTQQL